MKPGWKSSKEENMPCLGSHESHAYRPLAAHGFDGRDERVRGCHKIGLKTESEIKELKKERSRVWGGFLRCLSYPPHFLR